MGKNKLESRKFYVETEAERCNWYVDLKIIQLIPTIDITWDIQSEKGYKHENGEICAYGYRDIGFCLYWICFRVCIIFCFRTNKWED